MEKTINTIYKNIFSAIDRAQHVMLTMHRKPDSDTVGSCLAIAHYLDSINKPHTCFCVDELPSSLHFLPGKEKATSDPSHWDPKRAQFDLLIVLDSGDLAYNGIEPYVQNLKQNFTIINIDHHATNRRYGHQNLVLDTASSTCEIVHRMLHSVGAINKNIATCLLAGLIYDTGSFTNLATTASSIETASQLLLHGANIKQISQKIMRNQRVATLQLWGRALERLHVDPYGFATTAITYQDLKECAVDSEAIEGVANFLNNLDSHADTRAVLVLSEIKPGLVKGSFRTKHPLMDVSKLATLLGGGGHKKAAGFTLPGHLLFSEGRWMVQPINRKNA